MFYMVMMLLLYFILCVFVGDCGCGCPCIWISEDRQLVKVYSLPLLWVLD